MLKGYPRMRWLLLLAALLLSGPLSAQPGTIVKRDPQGRVTERWEPRPGGGYVVRDPQGRRLGTQEPGPGGTTILRDAQGRRVGTLGPR